MQRCEDKPKVFHVARSTEPLRLPSHTPTVEITVMIESEDTPLAQPAVMGTVRAPNAAANAVARGSLAGGMLGGGDVLFHRVETARCSDHREHFFRDGVASGSGAEYIAWVGVQHAPKPAPGQHDIHHNSSYE